SAVATRPIYLVAHEFSTKLVDLALEFNISKLRFGDISGQGIADDLKAMGIDFALRAPVADAISEIHALLAGQKLKDAAVSFEKLIKAHPTNMSVMTEYIDFLILSKDLNLAKTYLDQAQIMEPDDVRIKHLQARYCMRSKNFSEGIRILETLEKSNPWSPNRLIEMGDALLATSRFNEASERFDKALDLDPSNEAAKSGKAQSVLLSGDVQAGLDLLKNLGPPRQMAATLNAAAVFAARTNRVDDARNLYERGIQLLSEDSPSCSRLWYNLGILEHREEKLDRALECFTKSYGTDPTFKDAKHNLDIIRKLSGNALASSKTSAVKSSGKTIHAPSAGQTKKPK
ncbi:MAG: tetratricopeptide repeat protein, partial [Proteobacteria bacterium]|nr:tetratricopeptide repeat protein [Pseudomonadota bacterium]